MLVWHRRLRLIDHGAALYFHHSWDGYLQRSRDPFARIRDHVLLPFAGAIGAVDEALRRRLDADILADIVAAVPDAWLDRDAPFPDLAAQREAYLAWLTRRLEAPRDFVTEAIRARNL
jgi:hypothetical protein